MTGLGPDWYRGLVTPTTQPSGDRPRPNNSATPARDDLEFELPEIAKLRRRKLDRIRQQIDAWNNEGGDAA